MMGISFNLQDSFEEYLTAEHRCFLPMLRLIEDSPPSLAMRRKLRGRIPFDNVPIMRAFLAKHHFRIATVEASRNRLLNDPNLRTICGFLDGVPSTPTFSRRMSEFRSRPIMTETLNNMIADHRKRVRLSVTSSAIPRPFRPGKRRSTRKRTGSPRRQSTRGDARARMMSGLRRNRRRSRSRRSEARVIPYPECRRTVPGAARRTARGKCRTGKATSSIWMWTISGSP